MIPAGDGKQEDLLHDSDACARPASGKICVLLCLEDEHGGVFGKFHAALVAGSAVGLDVFARGA